MTVVLASSIIVDACHANFAVMLRIPYKYKQYLVQRKHAWCTTGEMNIVIIMNTIIIIMMCVVTMHSQV